MIGDLCDCDRMLVECGDYVDCGDPWGEEWGEEYDGQDWPDDDEADDDRCCYEIGGPDTCYCAERSAEIATIDREPIETITTTGGRL